MGFRRVWNYRMRRLARTNASPHRLAMGFAIGAAASFTPFIGLHFVMAIAIAFALRASLVASAIGTAVGNPLTFPLIWVASYNMGAMILGLSPHNSVVISTDRHVGFFSDGPLAFSSMLWHSVEPVIWPMVLGGVPLGVAVGAIAYWAVRASLMNFGSRRPQR
jgi:uncharacterized protein (DUF2062 family)